MLDKLIPSNLPYPIRGAIIRGIRTAIAFLLAGVSASIADGSLISGLGGIIPAAYTPVVTLLLTTTFVGVDKWLRERGLVEEVEAQSGGSLTDNAGETPSVVDVPPPAVNVNSGESVPAVDEATDTAVEEDVNPTEFDDPVTFEETNDTP